MKNIKQNIYAAFNLCIFACLNVCIFSSCNDFLDVKPKTEVEASDLFAQEQGYQDALWGVYTQMATSSLYGKQMTFGMVDVLGQVYSSVGSGTYNYMKSYNYTNTSVETIINAMWNGSYTAIANVNSLIQNLESADKNMFEDNHYNVLLGEAYGLRAFLHFDMLRLFAPSYAADPTAAAIPYVTAYDYAITPQSTVSEAIDLTIADLKKAAELMKGSDPIVTGVDPEDDDALLTDRYFHFNYYAAIAELARVYLYKNDLTNAATYAKEVINSGKFTWTSVDNIATSATNRDRTFTTEQVFALQVQDMEDNIADQLTETKNSAMQLTCTNKAAYAKWGSSYDALDARYTDASDWRLLYFWSDVVVGSYYDNRFCTKLYQLEDMPDDYAKRMPLIRLPELYLILAEAEGDGGAPELQTLQEHRGMTTPVSASTADALRSEILKEYLREFVCEGVMFYQYKRLNSTSVDGVRGTFKTANYVLPMPEQEIEFGNRE